MKNGVNVWVAICTIPSVFYTVNLSTTVLMSYRSPHSPFITTPAFNISQVLLECAAIKMPALPWYKIESCVRTSELYHVSNGHVPYQAGLRLPTAYVMPRLAPRSVFTTQLYRDSDTVSQALVIVHECAHLALGAHDIAYYWQEQFHQLTAKEHLANADSYLYEILRQCTTRH